MILSFAALFNCDAVYGTRGALGSSLIAGRTHELQNKILVESGFLSIWTQERSTKSRE